jgi:hypothetical protein
LRNFSPAAAKYVSGKRALLAQMGEIHKFCDVSKFDVLNYVKDFMLKVKYLLPTHRGNVPSH